LPDFEQQSQDLAALELLKESGAYDLILEGEIEGAIRKASKIWASLPGSTAQQNPKAMQYALDRFREAQVLYATTSRIDPPPLP
jgi:muramidase (phage lysozyme)